MNNSPTLPIREEALEGLPPLIIDKWTASPSDEAEASGIVYTVEIYRQFNDSEWRFGFIVYWWYDYVLFDSGPIYTWHTDARNEAEGFIEDDLLFTSNYFVELGKKPAPTQHGQLVFGAFNND